MKLKLQHLMDLRERQNALDICVASARAAREHLELYVKFIKESYGLKGCESIAEDGEIQRPQTEEVKDVGRTEGGSGAGGKAGGAA